MAQSQLTIFNEAIGLVAGQKQLASVNDQKPEAAACRLHYETARTAAFRMAYWPSIRKTVPLTLHSENDFLDAWTAADPPIPWRFAYLLPADFLGARYVFNADTTTSDPRTNINVGGDDGQFTIEYSPDAAAKILATNIENAVLTYVADDTDPANWDVLLYQTVVYMLAHKISLQVSGNPEFSVAMLQQAELFAQKALVRQGNDDLLSVTEPQSSIIQSRTGQFIDPRLLSG